MLKVFPSLVAAFLLLLLAVSIAHLPPMPMAHAASNATCDKSSVKVAWVGSWGTEKSVAMAGFEVWEWDVDTWSGANPVTISETSGAQTVEVAWMPLAAGYGLGICDTGVIRFNSLKKAEILANLADFKALAAHEMGHAIGLDHVGKQDSYDGRVPLMWSCGWGITDYRLTQDDNAAIQLQTDVSGVYRSATANSSFEEDGSFREFWGISSGASTSRYTGGVDSTPYYLGLTNTASRPYIFSTTALIDDPTIDWVKARANYKKLSPGDYGTVTVQLRVRTYDSGGSSCGTPRRRDGAHIYGTAYYYSKVCTPSLSWSYCDTDGQNPATKPAENGGVEVRVYVYNDMRNAQGVRTWIGLDRVRVLADY